jgi:surface polysaccharide O-acyltransferase-like enzyme
MIKHNRLIGIDFMKTIACFAVVWIHSSGGSYGAIPTSVSKIGGFLSGFAVPFFLAASFYLMGNRLFFSDKFYSFGARFKSLAIPYVTWTFIYSLFRVGKYIAVGDIQKLQSFCDDPIYILLLGGAGVHLYYLPLLISGVVLTFSLKKVLPNPSFSILLVLATVSILTYQLFPFSDNGFSVSPVVPFHQALDSALLTLHRNQVGKAILVFSSYILRCLPYIFATLLISHQFVSKHFGRFNIFSAALFLISAISLNATALFGGASILPSSINELGIACLLLLFAISLSRQKVLNNSFIGGLGTCSFGIYLIHQLFIDIIRPLVYKLPPSSISLISVSTCAVVSFGLSWLAVLRLAKSRRLSILLFGK